MSGAALAYRDALPLDRALSLRPTIFWMRSDRGRPHKAPKELPCKYFYDSQGSELFDRIC